MAGTPLFDALGEIRRRNPAPFHMPGHKGRLPFPLEEAAPYDITEIQGADSLYECDGPLRLLEQRMAGAYGAGDSLLSAGGSTLCIQTMLYMARRYGRTIIASRTIHRSAVAAMGLLGLEPVWVGCPVSDGRDGGIPGIALPPRPEDVEAALAAHPDAVAVYITSPDYFGQMADIGEISFLCHRRRKMLLVDNAHGAHLNRFRVALHPIALGADLCADSLHKTLPALTGAAALHLANGDLYGDAKYAMSLFGSTSPNYLIMLSADMALPEMESVSPSYIQLGNRLEKLKTAAEARGFRVARSWICDPVRMTLDFTAAEYTQQSFGRYLREQGVEPEYLGENVCVFMLTPWNTEEQLMALEQAVGHAPRGRSAIPYQPPEPLPLPRQILTISEAMGRPGRLVPLEDAPGRIAARLVSRCPPGLPLLVPGEEITVPALRLLKTSSIDHIFVVK